MREETPEQAAAYDRAISGLCAGRKVPEPAAHYPPDFHGDVAVGVLVALTLPLWVWPAIKWALGIKEDQI